MMNISAIISHFQTSSRRGGCTAGLTLLLALCVGLELVTQFLM